MFGLLKTKNPYEQAAADIYSTILIHVRKPVFYEELAIPDTFEGRFDLMVLHLFIVMAALMQKTEEFEAFNQALFDIAFIDMDQTLREAGIGDVGVPKHMRRMMKGFNGRVQAYHEAIGTDRFDEALARNLYGDESASDPDQLKKMKNYVQRCFDQLKQQPLSDVLEGRIEFAEI